MMSFMLAVLGSITFWIIYGIISIFMSVVTMKRMGIADDQFRMLTTGKSHQWSTVDGGDIFFATLCFIGHMIAWPFILLGYAAFLVLKVVFSIIGKMVRNILLYADKVVPIVKVNKKG